jgi:ATP adenylyltransferase
MKKLWAPWRMRYISSIYKKNDTGCIFCAKPKQKTDPENLILYRGKKCFVILNAFPYNNGHLMVVPYAHAGQFTALKKDVLLEMTIISQQAMRVLEKVLHAEGFNWGANIGRVAGAGIKDHAHVHIVPRWNGDANFMPVIGDVKVLSECLEDTYAKLVKEFKKIKM